MSIAGFHKAVDAGDRDAVEAAIAEDATLVHRHAPMSRPLGEEHWLPLHRAAAKGDAEMVALLLDRGANVDGRTRFHDPLLARATSLHLAAAEGRAEVVALLLSRGATVDAVEAQNYTPLHLAIGAKSVSAALALIDAGANVNFTCPHDPEGFTPLHRCVHVGESCLAIARRLLEAGADAEAFDPEAGLTPLQHAEQKQLTAYLEILSSC